MQKHFRGIVGLALASLGGAEALDAAPWAMAGDVRLRHEIQLLKDEDLIDGMVMTWPYNWGDLYYNLQGIDVTHTEYDFLVEPLLQRVSEESRLGYRQLQAFMYAGSESQPFRSFYSRQREEFEAGIQASSMGKYHIFNFRGTYAANATDGRDFRLDGSYVGLALGNWTFSLDQIDRWWGPGWEGSLILSNNARPFPAISLTRNVSYPFDLPVLKWFGNWTFSSFMGQLDDERAIPNAYFWGMRAEVQPFDALSLGFSRTAQWGGDGRPSGLGTFLDVLTGRDNIDENLSLAEEPGNQLAGFDWRLKPLKSIPLATYGQMIGEDGGGIMPTKYMFLGGLETWGANFVLPNSTWRLHVEYADTAARYHITSGPDDVYGAAYNHHTYKTGYRYRGLSMGHAMDGDGDMLSLGGLLCEENGRYWGFLLRRTSLNRHEDPAYADTHSVIREAADVDSIEVFGGFEIWDNFTIEWSAAYMDLDDAPIIGVSSEIQASLGIIYTY
ncbi:MAG: capsule assembly Wzi family protein [Opitutales bacterium]|nr:capsule assembly Wzi family protein [Opitutales bacterium]